MWTVRVIATTLTLLVTTAGCGSDSSTPTQPTPTAPNLVAGWSGTLTGSGVIVQTGDRLTNVCNQTWVIASQSGGRFSGTFQSSGGTAAPCAQAGTLSGSISQTGQVTDLQFSVSIGSAPPAGLTCTRTTGSEIFVGVASSTSITVQASDRLRCSGFGLTADLDRSTSLAMSRR